MLNAVIRFALRYRVLVVALSLAVLVYGGYVTATYVKFEGDDKFSEVALHGRPTRVNDFYQPPFARR